ncbi:MAG: hypothetical protein KC925_02100 [Candidatus Doudnabacteria bacterium]|nr:hypothetical protein [Candidatus Doudnabacteria bacterium]
MKETSMTAWMWFLLIVCAIGVTIQWRMNLNRLGRFLVGGVMAYCAWRFLGKLWYMYPEIMAPVSAILFPFAVMAIVGLFLGLSRGETWGDGVVDVMRWLNRAKDPVTGGVDQKRNNRWSVLVFLPMALFMFVAALNVPTSDVSVVSAVKRGVVELQANSSVQTLVEKFEHGDDNAGTFDADAEAAKAKAEADKMDAEAEKGTWWVWAEFVLFLLVFVASFIFSWFDEIGAFAMAIFGRSTGILRTVAEGFGTAAALKEGTGGIAKIVSAAKGPRRAS